MTNTTLVKILAINSSPKTKGHTARLLELFIKSAVRPGADVKRVNLFREEIKPVTGELKKKIKRLSKLQKALIECDGFVIASPTYWFAEPGILKDFIDNLTPWEETGFMLEGKVAGFIVFSPEGGETNVLENLALTFNQMGVLLPPYSLIFYRGPKDKWAIDNLKLLAKNIIQQIKAQKQLRWGGNSYITTFWRIEQKSSLRDY